MKKILGLVLAVIMVLGLSTTGFATVSRNATSTPAFKYFKQYYYQSKPGDYLNLMIQKADKKVTMARADYTQELTYKTITKGKATIKGTEVWTFTGTCVLVTYNESGEEIRSTPWKTSVKITFKTANKVLGVSMPKHGAAKGENFKGTMTIPQGGY